MIRQLELTSRAAAFAHRGAALMLVAGLAACADDASPTRPMEPAAASFGKNVTGLDFAASQTVRIAGTAFLDTNKNGAFDVGESSFSGLTVYLDTNKNGKLDFGEKSAVTASNGQYAFGGIAAGTYVVRIVQPTGYALTTAGSYTLTLSSGQVAGNEVFGESKTG